MLGDEGRGREGEGGVDRALKGQKRRVQESSRAPIFGLWGVAGGGGC